MRILISPRIHHDIKPANILVSQSTEDSCFDVSFKLADLGLTDFVVKAKNKDGTDNRDAHGTQMYSTFQM